MTMHPGMERAAATAILLFAFGISAAAAAVQAGDCPQEQAIYRDAGGGYALRFRPVASGAAAISHDFSVAVEGTELVLDGFAMADEESGESTAMLMSGCPEGDATGAEIRACTIWEGTVRGEADAALPDAGEPALARLELKDFGSSLRASALWGEGKAKAEPADIFDFAACAG